VSNPENAKLGAFGGTGQLKRSRWPSGPADEEPVGRQGAIPAYLHRAWAAWSLPGA